MTELTPDECRRILGVTAGATLDDIRRAFRKLVLQRHPDRNPGADPVLCERTIQAYRHLRQQASRPPLPRPVQPHELATTWQGLPEPKSPPASTKVKPRSTVSNPPSEYAGRMSNFSGFALLVAGACILAAIIAIFWNSCDRLNGQ